jgi:hypothetical protein
MTRRTLLNSCNQMANAPTKLCKYEGKTWHNLFVKAVGAQRLGSQQTHFRTVSTKCNVEVGCGLTGKPSSAQLDLPSFSQSYPQIA